MSINYTIPSNMSLEVSLFGPGTGESVCVHIGHGKWMIIDSCLNPETKEPAALEYLFNLGVEPIDSVTLIVISHWHSDHIKGLSQIVDVCKNAKIVWSDALKHEEYYRFFNALTNSPLPTSFQSEAHEISKVIKICVERKNNKNNLNFILGTADKRIFNENGFQVWCLSPSDAASVQSKIDIGLELTRQKKRRRRVPMTENLNSIAILVISPSGNVLLGADLEVSPNSHGTTGWDAVLNSSGRPLDKAKFVKIPHHGSKTGHHDKVWETMVESNSISMVTEYTSSSLPLPTDIMRMKEQTNSLYRTSLKKRKPHKREKTIERFIESTTTSRFVYEKKLGHIQLRSNSNEYKVHLNEAACKEF